MSVAIVFNSCFFGFFAHLGFARVLEAAGVPIGAAAGSSAGALAAAAVASGLGAARALDLALSLTREDFWDEDTPLGSLLRLGRVRGERIESLVQGLLPVQRIEQCPRPLLIAAVTVPFLERRILDRGPIARSVRASCAVPFLIQPVSLGGALLWDGGLRTEAPLAALLARSGLDRAIVHVGSWDRGGGRGARLDRGLWREIVEARRKGVRVDLARTVYPRLGPDHLHVGPRAVAAGERTARELLERLAAHSR